MNQPTDSPRHQGSLDMTRTDEPSAVSARQMHTGSKASAEAEQSSDAYLLTSPTYFLQYHGTKWNIKPSDVVHLVDQSARNAVVSVKHSETDADAHLFYLAHHPTEVWQVTEVFSPPSERQ